MSRRLPSLIFALFFLVCANTARGEVLNSLVLPKGVTIPPKTAIENVTYEKALPKYGECAGGEACVVMALSHYGVRLTQVDVHKASETSLTNGCIEFDLYAAGMNLGIDGDFYDIADDQSVIDKKDYLKALKYFISQGYPVVVSLNKDREKYVDDFCGYGLVVGYDDATGRITVFDPYSGTGIESEIGYKEFIDRWQFDLTGGGREFMMWVIKGHNEPYTKNVKKLTVHMTPGRTVEYALIPKKTGYVFLVTHFDKNSMVLTSRSEGMDGKEKGRESVLNESIRGWDAYNTGRSYIIRVTCSSGQGDFSFIYEPDDIDLRVK